MPGVVGAQLGGGALGGLGGGVVNGPIDDASLEYWLGNGTMPQPGSGTSDDMDDNNWLNPVTNTRGSYASGGDVDAQMALAAAATAVLGRAGPFVATGGSLRNFNATVQAGSTLTFDTNGMTPNRSVLLAIQGAANALGPISVSNGIDVIGSGTFTLTNTISSSTNIWVSGLIFTFGVDDISSGLLSAVNVIEFAPADVAVAYSGLGSPLDVYTFGTAALISAKLGGLPSYGFGGKLYHLGLVPDGGDPTGVFTGASTKLYLIRNVAFIGGQTQYQNNIPYLNARFGADISDVASVLNIYRPGATAGQVALVNGNTSTPGGGVVSMSANWNIVYANPTASQGGSDSFSIVLNDTNDPTLPGKFTLPCVINFI